MISHVFASLVVLTCASEDRFLLKHVGSSSICLQVSHTPVRFLKPSKVLKLKQCPFDICPLFDPNNFTSRMYLANVTAIDGSVVNRMLDTMRSGEVPRRNRMAEYVVGPPDTKSTLADDIVYAESGQGKMLVESIEVGFNLTEVSLTEQEFRAIWRLLSQNRPNAAGDSGCGIIFEESPCDSAIPEIEKELEEKSSAPEAHGHVRGRGKGAYPSVSDDGVSPAGEEIRFIRDNLGESSDKGEQPRITDKPEQPSVTDKPEQPRVTDKPEQPRVTDKPGKPTFDMVLGDATGFPSTPGGRIAIVLVSIALMSDAAIGMFNYIFPDFGESEVYRRTID